MTKTQEHNVPALRFPEFSKEWALKRLQDVADFQNGKAHEQNISSSGDYVVVNSKFISTEGRVKKFTDTQISPLFVDDIVMVMSDIPKGRALAKCYLIEQDNCYSLNQRICSLKARDAVPYYLFLVTNRNDYFLKFDSGVTQTNLRKDEVLRCPAYYPTLPEQQKIASFLSQVDRKIAQLGEKKALLQAYKKGCTQKLFSQELRFKDPQGHDFPDWEEKRLGEVAEFVGGGTPETGKPEYWGGEIQWFTPTEIKQKYLSGSKRTITKLGLQKSSAKLLPVGALLLSTRATVGDIGIAMKECTTNQGFQSLIVNSENINEFWYYWILDNKKTLLRRSSGSTFLEISKTEIAKIKADKPSLPEQQKIANFLSSIDRKIDLVATELDHAKTFKKGLLQQMFI